MADLTGIFTPFDRDERVDRVATERLIACQRQLGLRGLYVGRSYGEAMLQFRKARAEYLALVAEIIDGEMPLIAHVGAIATSDTLALAEQAARTGYQAISAIAPYCYGFSRGEVMEHFRTLAAGAELPLIIYNVPARVPGFSTTELQELLSHPDIIGLKNTSPDFFQMERILQSYLNALIYNGADEMCLAGLAIGAKGAIGTAYNFMSDLYVAMCSAVERSNLSEARKLQTSANEIIAVGLEVGVMPGSKALLEIMGVEVGISRPPFRRVDDHEKGRLALAARPLLEWRDQNSRKAR